MIVLPYAILPEKRAIRVKHYDLDDSWWKRGMSRCERDMQKIEDVLRLASGLRRIYCRHNRWHNYVEFRLNAKVFNAAACALRITFVADPTYEKQLMGYLD